MKRKKDQHFLTLILVQRATTVMWKTETEELGDEANHY